MSPVRPRASGRVARQSRSAVPPSSPGRSGRGGWQWAGWSRPALPLACEHWDMVNDNPAAMALPVPACGHPSRARSPSASGVPGRTAGGRAVPKQVSLCWLLPRASPLSQPPPSPVPRPPPGGPRRQHTAPTAPRWLSPAPLPAGTVGLLEIPGAGSNPPLARCELGMPRTDHPGTERGHGGCRVLGGSHRPLPLRLVLAWLRGGNGEEIACVQTVSVKRRWFLLSPPLSPVTSSVISV